jgi:hypothetical protein
LRRLGWEFAERAGIARADSDISVGTLPDRSEPLTHVSATAMPHAGGISTRSGAAATV